MKLFHGEITENAVIIHEEEQQHISKVLRMKAGEEIFVTDGKGGLAKGNSAFSRERNKSHRPRTAETENRNGGYFRGGMGV